MTEFPEQDEMWALLASDKPPVHVKYYVGPEQKIRHLYSSYNRMDPDDNNSFEILGLVALESFYEWIKTLPPFCAGDDEGLSSYVITGDIVRKVVANMSLEKRLSEIFREKTKEDAEEEESLYNLSLCAGCDLIHWLRGQGEAIAKAEDVKAKGKPSEDGK
jgi:hypothetical protein